VSTSSSAVTYRAFISYSHRDKTWADWLHKALETYRVPSRLVGTQTARGTVPRRLHPVFRDRDELASAHNLGREVNDALARSESLIVICSPASAASHWVNKEVLTYARLGRSERIACLIVDGEPDAIDMPGRESEECFCPALRFELDANGQQTTGRVEPVAADARPGKDGRTNAKLKLIAGILGVGFDALKQRELQRRNRRMTAIAALALLVMAVTTTLAVFALLSRRDAVIAQHDAVVAQHAAQRRQKQAESLVTFMLGDLNDKLAQVNRLDIMQAVDAEAMRYFQSLPATDVNDTALAQRAKALEKIGTGQRDLGNLDGALSAYHAAAAISSRLAAANRADSKLQVAHSQTLAWIGMMHWQQGALKDAQQDFESAKQALHQALAATPKDPALQLQLAYVDNNIGHVLEARGQSAAAVLAYQHMLDETLKAAVAKPATVEYQVAVGTAHNNLGKVALQRGDLATAIAQYRADDAIETRLSDNDPRNNNQRNDALRAHAILGRTLALAGNTRAGIGNLQQSVAMAEQLRALEPRDTGMQHLLALYSSQLARLQRLNGNTTAAATLNDSAITSLQALTKMDAGNEGWQSGYAQALTERAAELHARGQIKAARESAQKALDILDPMLAKHPQEAGTLLPTMAAKLLLASVTPDARSAASIREQALASMQQVRTDRADPRLLALQVQASLALARHAYAQPLIRQLEHEGYADAGFVALLQSQHIPYSVSPVSTQRRDEILITGDAGPWQPPVDSGMPTGAPTASDAARVSAVKHHSR
jgi:hypothetical protein